MKSRLMACTVALAMLAAGPAHAAGANDASGVSDASVLPVVVSIVAPAAVVGAGA